MFKDLTGKIRFLLAWVGVLIAMVKIIEYALLQFEGVKMPVFVSKEVEVEVFENEVKTAEKVVETELKK